MCFIFIERGVLLTLDKNSSYKSFAPPQEHFKRGFKSKSLSYKLIKKPSTLFLTSLSESVIVMDLIVD
jgi:hypothetical protein